MRFTLSTSLLLVIAIQQVHAAENPVTRLKLPPDFKISVYADVPEARSLAVDANTGAVYVGMREGNAVRAILDNNKDFVSDKVVTVMDNLHSPNGIAVHPTTGDLYIAEQNQVRKIAAAQLKTLAEKPVSDSTIVFKDLPDKNWHGWRYAKFNPEGQLFVAVGAPCNICDVKEFEGTIIRLNADGTHAEIFAKGVRNSVGFDFHPKTHELYFTDNGVDYMGDTIPPCELNHAPKAGLHFGFPYVWGKQQKPYPDAEKRTPAAPPVESMSPPIVEFDAHSAPLGVHFIQGKNYPKAYQNSALVALHGSWNRSPDDLSGYKVMRVQFDEQGNVIESSVFIEGWLKDKKQAWGRPADIAQLANGSILISDDHAGLVYKVVYTGNGGEK